MIKIFYYTFFVIFLSFNALKPQSSLSDILFHDANIDIFFDTPTIF